MSRPAAGRPLPDAGDRRRAATVFDRNLVVTAGAGTGKTALLVERALNLIGGGRARIDQLAVITFTEKAAAELRLRLAVGLDHLRALTAGPPPADPAGEAVRARDFLLGEAGQRPDEVAGRALPALLNLDAAAVSTIHSFCAEILRRYPVEAGVDAAFQIDDGPAADRVFEEEWGAYLAAELGPKPGREALWREALRFPGALEVIRALARALASFGLPPSLNSPDPGYGSVDPRLVLGPLVERLRRDLDHLLKTVTGANENMQGFLRRSNEMLGAFARDGSGGLAAALARLAPSDYLEKGVPAPGRNLAGADPEIVEEVAGRARDVVGALALVDEAPVGTLVNAALPLAARCRERLLASGFVSFDGLLRLVRDLLQSHPEARRELSARTPVLLVDEFQDTDPLQYEILFYLCAGGSTVSADPFDARLQAGRLFIVGDPKQSIYRFRGADIDAYNRAVGRIEACGGERLTLSASFRSPAEIVEPINRLFARLIRPSGDGPYEPPYEPIQSARGPRGGPRAEIWSVIADGNAEIRRRAEAEAIAAWIEDQRGRIDATGAALKFGQVAILLRALTNAGLYADALRRAGIPYIVEGGKDFYERSEVGDLVAFLRAVVNPHDAPAVLAVMRSPLGAVPDEELARFAAAGGCFDRPDGGLGDVAPFPHVQRTLELLASFRASTRGAATDDVIRAALETTPLLLLHASSFEGAQRLANLGKLVSRAGALARQGASLEETLDALEESLDGERAEGESPLADETIDAVRILSVHKAKGLEYPVVIVPDLGREAGRTRFDGTPRLEAARLGGAEALAIRLPDGTTNAAWIPHQEWGRRHEEAEEKRVFYVACTRAIERLILVNSQFGTKAAPWRDALAALGYVLEEGPPDPGTLDDGRILHRVVRPAPLRRVEQPEADVGFWSAAAEAFGRAAEEVQAATRPPFGRPSGIADARLQAGDGRSDLAAAVDLAGHRRRGADAVGRLAGAAVHLAMERWDFREPDALRRLLEPMARQSVEEMAEEPAPGGEILMQVVRETGDIVDGFLASGLPARLASLEVLGREMPVLYRDEAGTTWSGSCDLVYRDRDGAIVVADYKTDRVDGDPGVHAERYRAQLEIYREALRRALGQAMVRSEILFLRRGSIVLI